MKKIFFILCFYVSFFKSQDLDLLLITTGDLVNFNTLFDSENNVYGYFALYYQGRSSATTKKFEYIILDKNLNPIANKEFQGDVTASEYKGYLDNHNNNIILIPTKTDRTFLDNEDYFSPRRMEINLTTNIIKPSVIYKYQKGIFNEITEPKKHFDINYDRKKEKNKNGFNYSSYVTEIKEGGFFVSETNDYEYYTNNNSFLRYDKNKNELWRYKFNTKGNDKVNEKIIILEMDENYLYGILQVNDNVNKRKAYNVHILDMKTGIEVYSQPILGLTAESLDSIIQQKVSLKTIDDKIIIVGNNTNGIDNTGFYRLVLDKKNYHLAIDNLLYEKEIKTYINEIQNNGKIGNYKNLILKDILFLPDTNLGFVFEKTFFENYTKYKFSDIYFMITDKDFKIKEVKVLKKDASKNYQSDYLFSQYSNKEKDAVFYYRNLEKDKNSKKLLWKLYINTLTKGNFNQEIITISDKDSFLVIPHQAKPGYILLNEYNKNEKYNKIRLEKLNY